MAARYAAVVGFASIAISCGPATGPSDRQSSTSPPSTSSAPIIESAARIPSAPAPAPATPDPPPAPERAPASLIERLTGFPEHLETRPIPLPLRGSDPLIAGTILWALEYRTRDGFSAFQVYVCEGPCTMPVLERMKAVKTANLVQTKSSSLPGSRTLSASAFTMGLGGSLVASAAPSPSARFNIVTTMALPPHDIPVSENARRFFHESEPLGVVTALGRGLDAALF